MIKAVIFDVGGVFVGLDAAQCIRNFKEKAGFSDIEDYLDLCHQRGKIGEMESGDVTVDEFYEWALGHCRPGATREDIRYSFNSLLTPVPADKAEFVRSLVGKYDLYLLSNNNPITIDRCIGLMEEAGISRSWFKEIFVSCYMKMLKPGAEIFLAAIEKTGLPAEEILFVDDSMMNVEGAAAVGLKTVFYDVNTSLAECVGNALAAL